MSQAAGQQPNLQQVNAQARALIIGNALQMTQQIFSGSFTPASQNIITVNPRNVGLIRGFLVEVNGTIVNGGGGTPLTRTNFGPMNALSNILFYDLNNILRINTSGRHIAMLNAARASAMYGGAYTSSYPAAVGNNYNVVSAPSTIAATGGTGAVRMMYYIPLAYSPLDLRGAIYAATVNATMQLTLTINPTPTIASGDALTAMYSGQAGGGWQGAVTVTVYQLYYDQLPTGNTSQGPAPILPPLDLNNYYQLLETNLGTAMVANTDYPFGYANFRDYYSTMATYDNGGTFNSGSDVNYWSLVSSNLTQIFKYTPEVNALLQRQMALQDFPPGVYWFDSRGQGGMNPINTINFGNMQLNLNAATVNGGATLYIATEAFGQITQVSTTSGPQSQSAG